MPVDPRHELEVYRRQGIGGRLGCGRSPALLIIDFVNAFMDDRVLGGGNIQQAVQRTGTLLHRFRRDELPVCHTRVVYSDDGADLGIFAIKMRGAAGLTESNPASHIVPALAPLRGEYIVRKTQASAFFETGLSAWLIHRSIDTIFVAGCTTSGCVRATVVDAVSRNFRPLVVRDCVGDRALGPHEANLFDMDQKYADVITLDEAIGSLNSLLQLQGS